MNIQPAGSSYTAQPATSATTTGATGSTTTASNAAGTTAAKAGGTAEPSRDQVSAAVQKMNDAMLGSSQSIQFSIDEDSKDIVVKVIDQDTKEVVRQMPSKEALEIAKSLDKMQAQRQQGMLIDQTV
jgi:flagellar protein FlaG